MITATINEVSEANGQYGMEKKSRVTLADGEQKTVYTKPAAKGIYEALAPGTMVELVPKNSGTGYLIKSIIGQAATPPPPPSNGQAPAGGKADPQAIAEYIKTACGQYAYCVKVLREKFEEVGITDITDDLLKAGATSIFISTKNRFG